MPRLFYPLGRSTRQLSLRKSSFKLATYLYCCTIGGGGGVTVGATYPLCRTYGLTCFFSLLCVKVLKILVSCLWSHIPPPQIPLCCFFLSFFLFFSFMLFYFIYLFIFFAISGRNFISFSVLFRFWSKFFFSFSLQAQHPAVGEGEARRHTMHQAFKFSGGNIFTSQLGRSS